MNLGCNISKYNPHKKGDEEIFTGRMDAGLKFSDGGS